MCCFFRSAVDGLLYPSDPGGMLRLVSIRIPENSNHRNSGILLCTDNFFCSQTIGIQIIGPANSKKISDFGFMPQFIGLSDIGHTNKNYTVCCPALLLHKEVQACMA